MDLRKQSTGGATGDGANAALPLSSMQLYGIALGGERSHIATWSIDLGQDRCQALQGLSRREGVPPGTVLQAVLVAGLHCLGRNPVVALSVATDGGPASGCEIEMPEGSPTFLDLVALVRSAAPVAASALPVRAILAAKSLRLEVQAGTAALEPSVHERFPVHVLRLLDAMLADPATRIHAVDLMGEEERRASVEAFNDTAAPLPVAETLAGLFEARVRADGARTAVRCGDETVSYEALDGRANRLAHALARRGIGRGAVVGVFMQRTPGVVAAMLGISKVGAAWLPLDPSYPAERLELMHREAGARLVVVDGTASPPPGWALLEMEAACADESSHDPPRAGRAGDLAYLIFTSGSTGQPKGVRTSHRALLTWLGAMGRVGWVNPDDCMLAHSSLCFDASIAEVFLPLVTGASLALVSRETAADGGLLRRSMEEASVTTMFATPATWEMLLEAGWEGRPDFKAHCGGESWSVVLARRIRERVGQLWNVYGPTETTVYATVHRLDDLGHGLPIGRPLANYRAYVVNPEGMPVPPGVPGELLIGGSGVADGYLGQPERTAEKFVPDPFEPDPAEGEGPRVERGRLYRSGDLARMRSDGLLEIIGRIDHQVKIHGFRIEPGEIEAALEEHSSVQRAVVAARGETASERHLVAWVVSAAPVDANELRAYLGQRFPAFMVPGPFVFLSSFPTTSTGKIDRRALPEPRTEAASVEALQDVVEFQLCRIFEDVLGVRPVGRHQDYFDLGGTSFGVVRLLARIDQALGRRLPMAQVYTSSTPAALAALLRRDGWQPALRPLVPLQPEGNLPPFFCVHAFIGDVCRELGRNVRADQPFYGLQARGVDGREEPLSRVEDMAASYIAEIRNVQAHGPYYVGGYCFGGVVAFEMARQLEQAGEKVGRVVLIDSTPPNVKTRQGLGSFLWALERLVLRVSNGPQALLGLLRRGARQLLAVKPLRAGSVDDGVLERIADGVLQEMQDLDLWPVGYRTVARHNLLALIRYVPQPYAGKVELIRGRGEKRLWTREVTDMGWGPLVANLRVHAVDAPHNAMMEMPHVVTVAEILQQCLEQARREEAGVRGPAAA